MKSKITGVIVILLLLLTACKKEGVQVPEQPVPAIEMIYSDLGNREVEYNKQSVVLDINQDNAYDLLFGVTLVGDPIYQVDKRQFLVGSSFYTSIPVNNNEESAALSYSSPIPLEHFDGYNWYNASSVILIERSEFLTGEISWRGNWTGAIKKYLPFQIQKNGLRYNGWVELSVDTTNGKIILHRTAISKNAETKIIAGK